MKGVRGERLAGEFQKEIYNIITNKLRAKEPSLSVVISVTGADVAPDLKSAKIFISVYDTNKERADVTFEIIKENAVFIRREHSHIMTLRTVPELRFIRRSRQRTCFDACFKKSRQNRVYVLRRRSARKVFVYFRNGTGKNNFAGRGLRCFCLCGLRRRNPSGYICKAFYQI